VSTFYATFGVFGLFLTPIFIKWKLPLPILAAGFPLCLAFLFLYFFNYPSLQIEKRKREINQEIIYAGRFLIIELGAGVPLYNSIENLSENYEHIGKYFKEVVNKVQMGTALEDALREITETLPSDNLRKIIWQMLNSIKTGTDLTVSLKPILEHISKEQQIEVREYGRKLNPLAMFYMMVAVIIPSLGITLVMILATFLGFKMDIALLLTLAGLIAFVQFMFMSLIKSSRPPVDLE